MAASWIEHSTADAQHMHRCTLRFMERASLEDSLAGGERNSCASPNHASHEGHVSQASGSHDATDDGWCCAHPYVGWSEQCTVASKGALLSTDTHEGATAGG
jgi:hypothetical protein